MNNLFCESEIVAEESLESFYPYPQFKKKVKNKVISLNRMYLVKFKFRQDQPVEDKILFYFFLRQMFIKCSDILRRNMRSVTFDVDSVLREARHLGGSVTGGYGVVNEYRPEQFWFLFKALVNRPDLVVGGQSLSELLSNLRDRAPGEERVSMRELKTANREMSGRLVVPEAMKKFMEQAETRKNREKKA